jgi:ribosomal protein L3 glutamine methyltransferase
LIDSVPTLRDFVYDACERMEEAGLYFGHGTDNALDEAAWLAAAALHIPHDELDARADDALTAAQLADLEALLQQRIDTRKPLAYLLHEAWFAGRRFYVDERVIVPRSHLGEFIRDRFQPWLEPQRVQRALDLCTGSGCIAVALAEAFPQAAIDAADIAADALAVARINVDAHGLARRVQLVQSDLFAALAGERYDLIVTNPPYVDAADMAELPTEYRHEPAIALASGEHGLDAIIHILAHAPAHLTAHGLLAAEVGNSCTALQAAFPSVPFTWLTTATGDESVFVLSAEELTRHHDAFVAAVKMGDG